MKTVEVKKNLWASQFHHLFIRAKKLWGRENFSLVRTTCLRCQRFSLAYLFTSWPLEPMTSLHLWYVQPRECVKLCLSSLQSLLRMIYPLNHMIHFGAKLALPIHPEVSAYEVVYVSGNKVNLPISIQIYILYIGHKVWIVQHYLYILPFMKI